VSEQHSDELFLVLQLQAQLFLAPVARRRHLRYESSVSTQEHEQDLLLLFVRVRAVLDLRYHSVCSGIGCR
jgi:hypothetical protein